MIPRNGQGDNFTGEIDPAGWGKSAANSRVVKFLVHDCLGSEMLKLRKR